MKARVHKVRRIALGLYALALLLLPLLWFLFGENYWPLILLRYMPAMLFLFPVFLLSMTEPDRRVWIGSLGLCMLVLFFYLGLQLPLRGSPESTLSVLTYNIKAGLEGPEEIGDYLAGLEVDLICLQEARPPIANPEIDPVDAITRALPEYQMARGGARGELLILSKYPIISMAQRDLAGMSKALEVRIEPEGREVRVLTVHLMTGDPLKRLGTGDRRGRFAWLRVTAESRREQFEALSELMTEQVPTILTGDFNTPPNSSGHALLSTHLQDSFEEVGAGLGYTYPTRFPVWRIDYVWLSPHFRASTCAVIRGELSDHRPLLCKFRAINPTPDGYSR